ncbi:MAG: ABC-F family ATP-binding cassette domain-containing protein [Bacillota bacterium]|nr:ABC-F family ATP-binding cassette domain-containing protein [Bacillota bacterium]
MNLISIENLSKSYNDKVLFKDVSLGINEGDKIGLIGINGTGKSTLLKVIAGVKKEDSGNIIKGNSVRIEYLPQNPDFEEELTVLEQVFKGNNPTIMLLREYEDTLDSVNSGNKAAEKKLMELTGRMDSLGAWDIESEAKAVLGKLGINNFHEKIKNLSGGQKKRVALASALISPCDLLILDEPTNHLDSSSIEWLEDYLNKRRGSLLMITHDRYFLDKIVNRIIELDRGSLYTYKGNYSIYLEKKEERLEIEAASEVKRQSLLKKELAWIRRGAKARSTKQKARIDRFNALADDNPEIVSDKIEISTGSSRLGKKTIEINNVSKSFDRKLIDNISYIVLRDDRIGIIGPNGCGKSTLLNIIAGRLKEDSGSIEIGDTVKIGYYSQESEDMDTSLRAIEYIKEAAEYITTNTGDKITASQMMENFLFTGEQQWTPIERLSGGEKRRLYLLRVLMEAPNVLLLDEPTNDLDIETLSILEDYIESFDGPVITVSHDRYFLDKITNKIFSFEGNGEVKEYTGNYFYFRELEKEPEPEITEEKVKVKKETPVKDKPLKFTYKEEKEFAEIDNVIEEIENNISETENKINAASSDYALLQKYLAEKESLEKLLDEKMERWAYLNELAEKIEKQREK